jgi:hypothetical protein
MLKLYRQSGKPEPARLLVTVIKAMQSTDPKIGPEDDSQGWRPERNIDPRIMVSEEWAPMFQPLRPDVRLALTDALLEAWLDKNFEYRPAEYFHRGLVARNTPRRGNFEASPGGGSGNRHGRATRVRPGRMKMGVLLTHSRSWK